MRTVWLWMSKNVVGMATSKLATAGSMKVRPGEIIPTSRPPRNQTGMHISIPFWPSKSSIGSTIGRPNTSAAVSTPCTRKAMTSHCTLTPSCW